MYRNLFWLAMKNLRGRGKKLAVLLTVFMAWGMTDVQQVQADYDPNRQPIETSGPYNMTECQRCVLESSDKKQGIVYDHYDIKSGNYVFEKGKYCTHEATSFYVTMDGTTKVPLYWSAQTYENANGQEKYIGVLKPQDGQVWTKNTAIICPMPDMDDKCALYIASSEDGPRDLKIERSMDGGKDYKTLAVISFKEAKKLQNIFEDVDITFDDEDYECMDQWKIVYRISVASDYKMNGDKGLYNSSVGEMMIHDFSLYVSLGTLDTYDEMPSFDAFSAYKITDTKVKLSWNMVSGTQKYEIYERKGNGNFKKIRTIKATDAKKYSCTVRNLKKKGNYVFYVKAILSNQEIKSDSLQVNMKKQLIPKDIKLIEKIMVKKGKKKKIPLTYKKGSNPIFVKNIRYNVYKKKIAVIKKGKIVAKRKGVTALKVKVLLKSGLTKTLKTKIVVK